VNRQFVEFMRAFADRSLLKAKVGLQFRSNDDRPRIFCDEPIVVARFASELRQVAIRTLGSGTRVLLRGQTVNYPGMRPGLFRPPTDTIAADRLEEAEIHFEESVRRRINIGRFLRPNLAALLQHYGYRTRWLDVVDNLATAIWFAT